MMNNSTSLWLQNKNPKEPMPKRGCLNSKVKLKRILQDLPTQNNCHPSKKKMPSKSEIQDILPPPSLKN